MAVSSHEVESFFSTVQNIFNYFSESPKRWALLQSHALKSKRIVLKNLSDTRWSSRALAVKCIKDNIPNIYDALTEISESSNYDSKAKKLASQLGKRIFKFKFVLSAIIWNEFLARVNVVSKILQSKSIDFGSCLHHLAKAQEYFQKVHGDESIFDAFFEMAEKRANEMNIPVEFSLIDSLSLRSLRNKGKYFKQVCYEI